MLAVNRDDSIPAKGTIECSGGPAGEPGAIIGSARICTARLIRFTRRYGPRRSLRNAVGRAAKCPAVALARSHHLAPARRS
jgi:hypothetical protein